HFARCSRFAVCRAIFSMPIALRSWNRGLPLHAESAALLPRRCRRESDKILHEAIVPLAREGVLLLPLNRAAHLWRWDTTDPSRSKARHFFISPLNCGTHGKSTRTVCPFFKSIGLSLIVLLLIHALRL